MKKITAHASGRNYVLIVSDLTDFCAYHLGNTCPACQPDHNREAEYICFSQDCLKKDDQQKGRNAKKNFCKTHEEAVQPLGCNSAKRTDHNCKESRNKGRQYSNCQGNPAAVPEHGKNIPSHSICSKKELPVRSFIIV